MNSTANNNLTPNSKRPWTVLPDHDHPLEWCMNPEGDFLQGPLEMAFLRGKKIFLNLESGQLALLTTGETLRAVFLDGGHILDVGPHPGQINADSLLVFLAADHPLDLRWTFGNPLDLTGPGKRHIIGNCRLHISSPTLFWEHFLKRTDPIDAASVLDAIERTTRQTLTSFLDSACSESVGDQAGLQTTLMGLQPDTLSEDLASCGLSCAHLSLYTAQPPVENGNGEPGSEETAGHSPHLAHN